MTGYTTRHNLPYPTAGDPIHRGAEQMQALAESIDSLIDSTGGVEGPPGPEVDLGPLKAQIFGGADRTRPPLAEIAVQSNIVVPGGVDWLCDNRWSAVIDTDAGFSRSSVNNQTRYRIPVTGRYLITYQLFHYSNAAGGSLKVLVNGTGITKNTIASAVVRDSLEGPTMQLTTEYNFVAGDLVRWGYWYSQETTIIPYGFTRARSKIVIRYVG